MADIMWELKKETVRDYVLKGKRIDERDFLEYRPITIKENFIPVKAEGSAFVELGKTKVLVGVKLDVGEPFPDTPNEGILITNAELVPTASPSFLPGPPDENAIELARVVDRGIRESQMIDLEKLCIEEGEKVWMVFVDIHVLDDDGNLFDAANFGAVKALLNTYVPKYEDGQIIRGEKDKKLSVKNIPISCTFGKIGDKIFIDPKLEEEKALDARITVVTGDDALHAMQKGLSGAFKKEEIEKIVDIAFDKRRELKKVVVG